MNAATRTRDLEFLAGGGEVDVLVVGGGITGAGIALDAVSRGLSVALLERADLATGTSRWSSKLVHGGLRYLATGHVDVAWEAARERALLMGRIAPHLVRALPFVFPLTPQVSREKAAEGRIGFTLGDGLRAASGLRPRHLPRHTRISAHEARALVPALGAARGALLQWDGRLEDDARLVVAVARTAAALGARVVTHARVLDGGDRAVDERTGQAFDVRARHVVWATGVWTPHVPLRPSKGSHLLLRPGALGHPRAAVTVPVPGQAGRWVFAVPRPDGQVLTGLTDDPYDGPPDAPAVLPGEERFLLETLSSVLDVELGREDVVGRFAGLRPLLAAEGETKDLSRRHAIVRDGEQVTVVGGKLTTYRRMAQDAVDAITDRPCRTHGLPLAGAGLAPPGVPARLARRFGAEAGAVASSGALVPLAPGVPALAAEVAWARDRELALDADDVERRLRLDLDPAGRAAAREAIEALLAEPVSA